MNKIYRLATLVAGVVALGGHAASAQKKAAPGILQQEMAYPCPALNASLTATSANGQVGSISYENAVGWGVVDIYTPVTVTADGDDMGSGVYVWSIYTSTGPASYTSSQSGNQLFITPSEPQSMYAPNGQLNDEQFYGITCTMSSRCGHSAYIEWGLYSSPTGGPGGLRGAKPEIAAYPNPSDEQLVVSTGRAQQAQAALYNQQGLLQKSFAVTGSLAVSTQDLAPGIYLLRVTTKDGQVVEKRISVRH